MKNNYKQVESDASLTDEGYCGYRANIGPVVFRKQVALPEYVSLMVRAAPKKCPISSCLYCVY